MALKISAVVLIAIIAAVQAGVRVGWSTPAPPTTTPAPPSGWGPPPPPPPPSSNVTVALSGELAATGSGWAAENHAENIHVTGGWGIPANLDLAAGGESEIYQDGQALQVSSVDAESASSLNTVSVAQGAEADESVLIIADGLEITVGQSGWAGAAAEGASVADGDTSIVIS